MNKIFTLVLILDSAMCFAQWNSDPSINTVVCATQTTQQLYHEMIHDGNGGAYITWIEAPLDLSAGQIYAQHISSEGMLLLPQVGIAVAPSPQVQTVPHIISDGINGAIISWLGNENGTLSLHVQKISAMGQPQWGANGVAVAPAAGLFTFTYKLISDGDGGAIIIWDDNRNVQSRVYAQRIASSGSILWQSGGVPCSPLFTPYSQFDAITDSTTQGFFLCWPFVTGIATGMDIFVQRVTGEGIVLWGSDGKNICGAFKDQFSNKIITDGNSGVILLWQDFREDPKLSGIYGQRVDSSGRVYWDEYGKLICDSIIPSITYFQVISDGSGGGIVAWLDSFIIDKSHINNLFARHFDSSGVSFWPDKKIVVWEDLTYISPFQMTTDNEHGSFITWNHVSDTLPVGNESNDIYNVYAQHLYPDGLTQWPDSGTLVSSATQNQNNPQITCVGTGAAIIAWTDTRSATNYDIYAARLASSPVPVEWLSFTAVREGKSHILKWEIAYQYNSQGFFIEKGTDGIHFESIGFVAAQGKSYHFTDDHPLQGENYYRLKQVDFDGKFKYSKTVYLYMLLEEVISSYPNPVSGILKVNIQSTKAKLLHILNSYGQLVKIKSISTPGITEINVSNLPSGIYYIKTDSGSWARKFIKQ